MSPHGSVRPGANPLARQRSACSATARRPRARIDWTTSCASPSEPPKCTATSQPRAAKPSASPRPMRFAAPVISTTRAFGAEESGEVDGETLIYNAGMNPKAHESDSLPVPGPDALAQSEALAERIPAE